MKRSLILIFTFTCLIGLLAIGLAAGSDKDSPITGTWDCQSKGRPEGDLEFTLYLKQSGEDVEGSVSSPLGDAPITSGNFKGDRLEIHIDTDEGNYVLIAKLDKGTLTGTWAKDEEKGTWTGKLAPPK